jgi:predicted dehydrogenase
MRGKRAVLRVGVLGAGMIGDVHVDRIRKDGRAEVTWIAARTEKTLRRKQRAHSIPNATLDYREVLADATVGAVVIAGPPHTHLEMTLAALEAGKHILLEKPMVVSRAQMEQVLSAARCHPEQVVLECSCRHARLQPKFRLVKDIIESGEIGDVYHVAHAHLTRSTFLEYNPRGTWSLRRSEAGGGPFFDWGVYDLSFHLGVLGDRPRLQRVEAFMRSGLKVASSRSGTSAIEEHGVAHLHFDGGLTYDYERGAGVHMERPNETRIYGTRGGLRFGFCSWDAPIIEVFSTAQGRAKHTVRKVSMLGHGDDNLQLTRHFLDCVLNGARPLMTVDRAAKHLEILLKIYEAAGVGTAAYVP